MNIKRRNFTEAQAPRSTRKNAYLCRECPCYHYEWCRVFAKHVGLFDFACNYGHDRIKSKIVMESRGHTSAKTKTRKGKTK